MYYTSILKLTFKEPNFFWMCYACSIQVITMLLTAAISASAAIAQVGKKGNRHAGWLPTCGQIHSFCQQVMGSMICGFIGVVIYLVILLHAIHKFNQLLPYWKIHCICIQCYCVPCVLLFNKSQIIFWMKIYLVVKFGWSPDWILICKVLCCSSQV